MRTALKFIGRWPSIPRKHAGVAPKKALPLDNSLKKQKGFPLSTFLAAIQPDCFPIATTFRYNAAL